MKKVLILTPESFTSSLGISIAEPKTFQAEEVISGGIIKKSRGADGKLVIFTRIEANTLLCQINKKQSNVKYKRISKIKEAPEPQVDKKISESQIILKPQTSKPAKQHIKPKKREPFGNIKKTLSSKVTEKIQLSSANNVVPVKSLTKVKSTLKNGKSQSKAAGRVLKNSSSKTNVNSSEITQPPAVSTSQEAANAYLIAKESYLEANVQVKSDDLPLSTNRIQESVNENTYNSDDIKLILKDVGTETSFHYCIKHKLAVLTIESAYISYKRRQCFVFNKNYKSNDEVKYETPLIASNDVVNIVTVSCTDESVKDNIEDQSNAANYHNATDLLIDIIPKFSLSYPFTIFSVLKNELNSFNTTIAKPFSILHNVDKSTQIKEAKMKEFQPLQISQPHNIISSVRSKIMHDDCLLPTSFRLLETKILSDQTTSEKGSAESLLSFNSQINNILESKYVKKKLRKPSDTVQKLMKTDNSTSSDFLSGEFYKELDFLDSFIELLEKVENTSTNTFHNKDMVRHTGSYLVCPDVELKQSKCLKSELQMNLHSYDGTDLINNKPISKDESLKLLNILIQDENRRAKNLLLIIKMREDALRDFTKSQILWLESQKKDAYNDSTDLKKKQRGALMKLEQEFNEIHRMKKVLISKYEQRKLELKQTKRNLEAMIVNDLNEAPTEDDIRSLRNSISKPRLPRRISPLKCFDLSLDNTSSDINIDVKFMNESADNSETSTNDNTGNIEIDSTVPQLAVKKREKMEKGIQTVSNFIEMKSDVDIANRDNGIIGLELNKLFQNLSGNTCEIFNNEKLYELNFEVLRDILQPLVTLKAVEPKTSIDNVSAATPVVKLHIENDIKPIDEQGNSDSSASSTNSTARSLVDELDIYYLKQSETSKEELRTDISEDHSYSLRFSISQPDGNVNTGNTEVNDTLPAFNDETQIIVFEDISIKEHSMHDSLSTTESIEELIGLKSKEISISSGTEEEIIVEEVDTIELEQKDKESEKEGDSKVVTYSENTFEEITSENLSDTSKERAEESLIPTVKTDEMQNDLWVCTSNVTSPSPEQTPQGSPTGEYSPAAAAAMRVALPPLSEAEELRRKQLAIEMEIKALEKQQTQLTYCLVREIPDKPPPPYTMPATNGAASANETFTMNSNFPTDKSEIVEKATFYFNYIYNRVESLLSSSNREQLDLSTLHDEFERPFDEFMFDLCKNIIEEKVTKHSSPNLPLTVTSLRHRKDVLCRDTLYHSVMAEVTDVMGFKEKVLNPKPLEWRPKRTDQIDDILFQDLNKRESEWTSLENDEADVKKKLVDDILTMLIKESVDDYLKVRFLKESKCKN